MRIRGILPMLVVSMMVLTPLSLANHEGGSALLASPEPSMSQAENVSGWLASAGGASYERVSAMVPLPNGSMLVGGLFEQNVEFHGDVIGFSSDDSSFGVDFFLGWLAGRKRHVDRYHGRDEQWARRDRSHGPDKRRNRHHCWNVLRHDQGGRLQHDPR